MINKAFFTLFILVLVSSCSTHQKQIVASPQRLPSNEESCHEIAKNLFIEENYSTNLIKSLEEKKLVSTSNKFVTVQHPRLDWINRARASLNQSLKNWNNNRYPAFYFFNDEDIVEPAKKYFRNVEMVLNSNGSLDSETAVGLDIVTKWITSFKDYPKEIDQLLEERISLQYNLSLLKKIKLEKNEVRDIQLSIKRQGQIQDEILTLRKNDKDLEFHIKRLKKEIQDFDGTFFRNGKIKDRIIRQAMLQDVMTILHREFEYNFKNSPSPSSELKLELERLQSLLKQNEFSPTTYGVYRITNKIFIRELAAFSKLDIAYKNFIENPSLKIKEIINAFIQNRQIQKNDLNEKEKIGIFKKLYVKVTNLSARQIGTGAGVVGLAALGFERYFWVKDKPETLELPNQSHEEQIQRSTDVHLKESAGHSEVIEIQINDLINL